MSKVIKDPITGAETTGHVWDETLMEFNNPLPRWWVYVFYGTIIFSLVYWVMYPSFPVGKSYFKGIGNDITYLNDKGEEVTTHWNTRALLAYEKQTGIEGKKRKEALAMIGGASYEDIASDAKMSEFVRSYGNGIFGDYCAACHQTGANGVAGLYPNLVDNAWLWGGDTADIEATIRHGRQGYMPGFAKTFNDEQLDQVANYVMSLSGDAVNAEAVAKGEKIFKGEEGGCYYCHTSEGSGMKTVGAADLTDSIWTVAHAQPGEELAGEVKLEQIKSIIADGVSRDMPGWSSRLSDNEIKVLVAYIKGKSAE